MIKLKPCPFCGGTAKIYHEQRKGIDGSIAKCGICFSQSRWKMVNHETASDEDAAKAWNKRHLEENEIDDEDVLISRKAAIDALGEKPATWNDTEYELGTLNQWKADVEAIKNLPSAQPEIIRCKDCKHKYVEKDTIHCPFGLTGGEYFYCAYGVREYE